MDVTDYHVASAPVTKRKAEPRTMPGGATSAPLAEIQPSGCTAAGTAHGARSSGAAARADADATQTSTSTVPLEPASSPTVPPPMQQEQQQHQQHRQLCEWPSLGGDEDEELEADDDRPSKLARRHVYEGAGHGWYGAVRTSSTVTDDGRNRAPDEVRELYAGTGADVGTAASRRMLRTRSLESSMRSTYLAREDEAMKQRLRPTNLYSKRPPRLHLGSLRGLDGSGRESPASPSSPFASPAASSPPSPISSTTTWPSRSCSIAHLPTVTTTAAAAAAHTSSRPTLRSRASTSQLRACMQNLTLHSGPNYLHHAKHHQYHHQVRHAAQLASLHDRAVQHHSAMTTMAAAAAAASVRGGGGDGTSPLSSRPHSPTASISFGTADGPTAASFGAATPMSISSRHFWAPPPALAPSTAPSSRPDTDDELLGSDVEELPPSRMATAGRAACGVVVDEHGAGFEAPQPPSSCRVTLPSLYFQDPWLAARSAAVCTSTSSSGRDAGVDGFRLVDPRVRPGSVDDEVAASLPTAQWAKLRVHRLLKHFLHTAPDVLADRAGEGVGGTHRGDDARHASTADPAAVAAATASATAPRPNGSRGSSRRHAVSAPDARARPDATTTSASASASSASSSSSATTRACFAVYTTRVDASAARLLAPTLETVQLPGPGTGDVDALRNDQHHHHHQPDRLYHSHAQGAHAAVPFPPQPPASFLRTVLSSPRAPEGGSDDAVAFPPAPPALPHPPAPPSPAPPSPTATSGAGTSTGTAAALRVHRLLLPVANARDFFPGNPDAPAELQLSCVRVGRALWITSTDICRIVRFRLESLGWRVLDQTKLYEGVYSDLRTLRKEHVRLERPCSALISHLFHLGCVATLKAQKLYDWREVRHDALVVEAMQRSVERHRRREATVACAPAEGFDAETLAQFEVPITQQLGVSRHVSVTSNTAAATSSSTSSSSTRGGGAVPPHASGVAATGAATTTPPPPTTTRLSPTFVALLALGHDDLYAEGRAGDATLTLGGRLALAGAPATVAASDFTGPGASMSTATTATTGAAAAAERGKRTRRCRSHTGV